MPADLAYDLGVLIGRFFGIKQVHTGWWLLVNPINPTLTLPIFFINALWTLQLLWVEHKRLVSATVIAQDRSLA